MSNLQNKESYFALHEKLTGCVDMQNKAVRKLVFKSLKGPAKQLPRVGYRQISSSDRTMKDSLSFPQKVMRVFPYIVMLLYETT